MNRSEIKKLEELLFESTGKNFDGEAIWDEIETAASEAVDDGEQWIVGQDDINEQWEYFADIKRTYDAEYDSCDVEISISEIVITDKKQMQEIALLFKDYETRKDMLIYKDIIEKLAESGYNTTRIRKEKIFPESTLTRIRNNKPIRTDTIELICELTGLQPGDLMEVKENT